MQINFAEHPILAEAVIVLYKLEEAGHSAYFVGGAVRDVLLGRSIHDVDIATSATPAETMTIFPKTFATGLQHGTVTVVQNYVNYEVTTFRVEAAYVDFRRPDGVSFVKELKVDLSRRDFTMNAMAINAKGELIDYFGGKEAIAQKVVKAVGNPQQRFQEDALRMLRAIRFATTYNFSFNRELWQAIIDNNQLLSHIAMERVAQELEKTIDQQKTIQHLFALYDSQLLNYTKSRLQLQSVLHYWFSSDYALRHSTLLRNDWFWSVLYYYSHTSETDARKDFSALVFSKKYTASVCLHMAWLRFFEEATDALTNKTNEQHFLAQYGAILTKYSSLINHHEVWCNTTNPIKQCMSLFWLEQLQFYPQAYMAELKPLMQVCELDIMINFCTEIEQQQQLKKISHLNISAKQLVHALQLEAGPWLSSLLQQLYMGVNLNILKNDRSLLMEAHNYLSIKRGSDEA